MKTMVLMIILLDPGTKLQAVSVTEMQDMATCLAMKEAILQEYSSGGWGYRSTEDNDIRCVEAKI